MTSRYGSHLSDRSGRSSLFANYDSPNRTSSSHSSGGRASPYGNRYSSTPDTSSPYSGTNANGPSFSAYPDSTSNGAATQSHAFRPATPNAKGQYSVSTLEAMESQNDEQVSTILGKITQLKGLTMRIGDEIRDSSSLAESMNEGFAGTSVRLKNTMNRMLVMAEKTGVGWRAWVGFFAAVVVLFWYVWLF